MLRGVAWLKRPQLLALVCACMRAVSRPVASVVVEYPLHVHDVAVDEQVQAMSSQSVADAEVLLCLLSCVIDGWPSPVKNDVPVEIRELMLQVHARCVIFLLEGCRQLVAAVRWCQGGCFSLCGFVMALLSWGSDVAKHRHHAVVLAYLEITTRYSSIFKHYPDFLPPVIITMMGAGYVSMMQPCVFFAARLGRRVPWPATVRRVLYLSWTVSFAAPE